MPFSEKTKLEANRRSNFTCVVCNKATSVEVHHIVPEAEEGGDELRKIVFYSKKKRVVDKLYIKNDIIGCHKEVNFNLFQVL